MRRIKTAIIAAAGKGNRFMPFTSVFPKEMLPIQNRPILHWLVDECIEAKIEKVYIVIDKNKQVIREYFKKNRIRKTKVVIIEQKENLPYGNGTPLLCCKDLIKDDYFAYFYGDDIVYPIHEGLRNMISSFGRIECEALIAVERVVEANAHKFGIVHRRQGTSIVLYIHEKPDYLSLEDQDPVASFGRFIFPKRIFDFINPELTSGINNELWLVNVINKASNYMKIESMSLWGKWLTITDPQTYLKMLNYINNHEID